MRERLEFYSAVPECLRTFEEEGFVAIVDGTVYFRDPLYGEIVQPGEPPRGLLEDEIFLEGIPALQQVTQQGVELKVAYNLHGGEEDFERLCDKASYLRQCKLVGLEWGSDIGSEYPQSPDEIRFHAMTNSGNGGYCRLTKDWLERAGVQTIPSDINTHMVVGESMQLRPHQGAFRDRLGRMLSHNEKVEKMDKVDRPWQLTVEDWTEHGLAWSNYQYFRQYLLLAHFGYMVAKYEDQLQPGDSIGLVIGSGHRLGIPQKAEQLGIAVQPIEIQLPADTARRRVMFERAMPEGEVSIGDLREMAIHHFQTNDW